jgi:hypothetical protein
MVFTLINTAKGQWDWQDPLGNIPVPKGEMILVYGGVVTAMFYHMPLAEDSLQSLTYQTEYLQGYKEERKTHIAIAKVAYKRKIKRWLQLGGAVYTGYFFDMKIRTQVVGALFSVDYSIVQTKKSHFFFNYDLGGIFIFKEFPIGGTRFNFTPTYGLNYEYKVGNNAQLGVGVKHMHISNAYIFGDDKNPSFDALGGMLSLRKRF